MADDVAADVASDVAANCASRADVALTWIVFNLQQRVGRVSRVEARGQSLEGACGACGVLGAPFDRRKIPPCSSRREQADGMLKINF